MGSEHLSHSGFPAPSQPIGSRNSRPQFEHSNFSSNPSCSRANSMTYLLIISESDIVFVSGFFLWATSLTRQQTFLL